MEAAAANLSNDPGWALRADLALCYRVVAHYGLTDQIYTHISARVPGAGDRFLLNRLGPSFDEMTAGDLMEVGFEAPPE
ncbi:MAG: class II aldolase/adducin family protein, partial [Alphaproteobacteria bacterium]